MQMAIRPKPFRIIKCVIQMLGRQVFGLYWFSLTFFELFSCHQCSNRNKDTILSTFSTRSNPDASVYQFEIPIQFQGIPIKSKRLINLYIYKVFITNTDTVHQIYGFPCIFIFI